MSDLTPERLAEIEQKLPFVRRARQHWACEYARDVPDLLAEVRRLREDYGISEELLATTRQEFARHMDSWNEMKEDRDRLRALLGEAREALRRSHLCATVNDAGECDGCFVSATLAKLEGM